jgi:GntR family transcriptional regulator
VTITNQIFEQIFDQVMRGELKPGDQLPTVRKMAQTLKVNFNTVARAYRLLDEAGVISTQHGRGTYILPVVTPYPDSCMEKLDELTRRYLLDASELGASAGEVLAIFQRNLKNWTDADESRSRQNESGSPNGGED